MILGLVMGTVGAAIGIVIGILIYSSVTTNVSCPNATTDPTGNTQCTNAKNTGWSVLGILPTTLFFGLFYIFRNFG